MGRSGGGMRHFWEEGRQWVKRGDLFLLMWRGSEYRKAPKVRLLTLRIQAWAHPVHNPLQGLNGGGIKEGQLNQGRSADWLNQQSAFLQDSAVHGPLPILEMMAFHVFVNF